MFKQIENELMSIMNEDPIEKVAHMPNKSIAKTMDLIYNIKFEDIERVYTESLKKLTRMVVIYKCDKDKGISQDLCPINGTIYHITFFPSHLLNKNENNAINLAKAIIKYTSYRVSLLIDEYNSIMKKVKDNLLDLVIFQAIPVVTCAVMRKIYSGSLAKVIYTSLIELFPAYKNIYSEEGVNSTLNLMDEGLGIDELIDSGFICAIPCDDEKYPGIWCSIENNEDKKDEQ